MLTNEFVATLRGANGNTARSTLRLGTPVAPPAAPTLIGGSLAAAQECLQNVDKEHDLVVPFQLELTNLNTSISLPANFATVYVFVFNGESLPLDEGVSAVEFFSGGPKCAEVDPGDTDGSKSLVSLRLVDNLAAGASLKVDGYVLLSAVVQPSFPNGDPAMLQRAYLTPQQRTGGPETSIGSGAWQTITPPIGQITSGIPLRGSTG